MVIATEPVTRRRSPIGDYLRRTASADKTRCGFWEWFHFAVRLPTGPDLVVNLCTAPDPRTGASPSAWFGCSTILVHDGDWSGDTVRHEQGEVQLGAGRVWVAMGDNTLSVRRGVYHLHASSPRDQIRLDLDFVPLAMPATATGVQLAENRGLSWFVLPRLAATGIVEVGRHTHHLQGALAYHDHNWGPLGGADLSWEWGYCLPKERGAPESVFFVRILDRARCTTHMQGLFLWSGGRPLRLFRDGEMRIARTGERLQRSHVRPRVCSLLVPPLDVAVPRTLRVEGSRGEDWLALSVDLLDAIRIAMPDGPHEDLLVIHESRGLATLSGSIDGAPIEVETDGFFEFVTR
jgi:hypothetical protein